MPLPKSNAPCRKWTAVMSKQAQSVELNARMSYWHDAWRNQMRYAESNCSYADSHCKKVYVLAREQSAGLFCEAPRRFVWKRQGGGVAPTPLLSGRRWRNTVSGRGLTPGIPRHTPPICHTSWEPARLRPPDKQADKIISADTSLVRATWGSWELDS